jgi:hypothetical protein
VTDAATTKREKRRELAKALADEQPAMPTPEQRRQSNLRIWSVADVTDPTHTREAKPFGKVITAIDSYYQIKRATETFGPLGQGWGYDLDMEIVTACSPHLVVVTLALWYIDPLDAELEDGQATYDAAFRIKCPPVITSNKLTMGDGKDGKPDEECFKKAITDAITKSLSYLGFSADIFMGLYDDAKYKAAVTERFRKERAGNDAAKAEMPAVIVDGVKKAQAIADGRTEGGTAELEKLFYSLVGNPKADPPVPRSDAFKGLTRPQQDYVLLQFKMAKAKLDPAEPDNEAKGDVAA